MATPFVQNMLAQPELPDEMKEEVIEAINKYKEHLKKFEPGLARTAAAHESLDSIMVDEDAQMEEACQDDPEEWGAYQPPSCKKGCTFCCHRLVVVTDGEAQLLARKLRIIEGVEGTTNAISTKTQELLNEQAKYSVNQDLEYFFLPKEQNKCVFLDNQGACKVYEHRPMECRKLRVVSDPYHCSPEAKINGEDTIELCNTYGPEYVASAAADLETSDLMPMARALLGRLEKDHNTQLRFPKKFQEKENQLLESLEKGSRMRVEDYWDSDQQKPKEEIPGVPPPSSVQPELKIPSLKKNPKTKKKKKVVKTVKSE